MKRFLALLLSVLLLLGAVACRQKGDSEEEAFYIVSFNTASLPYEATPPAVQSVKQGESVAAPTLDAEPSAGYVVIWTTDVSGKTPYDFSSPVEESFVLYAVEAPRNYTVTYLLERGVNDRSNITSFTMSTATFYLRDPDLTGSFGYKFIKWAYYDDPESTVTCIEQGTEGDIILRAVIEPVDYLITYFGDSTSNPNPAYYSYGTTLSLERPLREGYRFLGYTIMSDPDRTPVTVLTAEFVEEHRSALFYENGTIGLKENWELLS